MMKFIAALVAFLHASAVAAQSEVDRKRTFINHVDFHVELGDSVTLDDLSDEGLDFMTELLQTTFDQICEGHLYHSNFAYLDRIDIEPADGGVRGADNSWLKSHTSYHFRYKQGLGCNYCTDDDSFVSSSSAAAVMKEIVGNKKTLRRWGASLCDGLVNSGFSEFSFAVYCGVDLDDDGISSSNQETDTKTDSGYLLSLVPFFH